MIEQTTAGVPHAWYGGILAYLSGVVFSYGSTGVLKSIISGVGLVKPRNWFHRFFAFMTGAGLTWYVWGRFYGPGHDAMVVAVVAGITAPVVWKIYYDWRHSHPGGATGPDNPDLTWWQKP